MQRHPWHTSFKDSCEEMFQISFRSVREVLLKILVNVVFSLTKIFLIAVYAVEHTPNSYSTDFNFENKQLVKTKEYQELILYKSLKIQTIKLFRKPFRKVSIHCVVFEIMCKNKLCVSDQAMSSQLWNIQRKACTETFKTAYFLNWKIQDSTEIFNDYRKWFRNKHFVFSYGNMSVMLQAEGLLNPPYNLTYWSNALILGYNRYFDSYPYPNVQSLNLYKSYKFTCTILILYVLEIIEAEAMPINVLAQVKDNTNLVLLMNPPNSLLSMILFRYGYELKHFIRSNDLTMMLA